MTILDNPIILDQSDFFVFICINDKESPPLGSFTVDTIGKEWYDGGNREIKYNFRAHSVLELELEHATMPLKPEQQAREKIDSQLDTCGWVVQDFESMDISAGVGVAVREYPLKWTEGTVIRSGFADYLLYADGLAIGVLEAKPAGHTLEGVVTQSERYTKGLSADVSAKYHPLPFAYESTGEVTQFTNGLDPDPRSREIFRFHRPEELLRLQNLGSEEQLRRMLQRMPRLPKGRLWDVQYEAIQNLEQSLARASPRSLIQMATGSGKTFTAVTACYRLIEHAKAKRILFLVDRNNLGNQTVTEFQQFRYPGSVYSFADEFVVRRLTSNTIDPASKVVITTIQRLYSMLKGDPKYDSSNENTSLFESGSPLGSEPVPVEYTPLLPIEYFDFIIIDECHRSIYNIWRQVIEYFDTFLIGLTATPSPQTIGFFNNNVVQNYSHSKAVADGINVGYDIYRIKTRITEEGRTIPAETGVYIPKRDRRTRKMVHMELEDDLTYTANQLDRDVVAPDQIRVVARTFRDHLTKIFPGRTEVPKTLVFAKNDSHADDIVRILKNEFSKGNKFCQKITSKTTGASPEDLLSNFRNLYNPRIVVTVDMIATGTDVKPIECILFMRNVNSAGYFEQMKGRGVRVIQPDDLRKVTPDAKHKTHFVIIDAVGVCERDRTVLQPLERRPSTSTEKLLQMVASGIAHEDLVQSLASRLARLGRRVDEAQTALIKEAADGLSLAALTDILLTSIDPQGVHDEAVQRHGLAEDEDPTSQQLDTVQRERMIEALKPFITKPELRRVIIEIHKSRYQIIDEGAIDVLLDFGHSEAAVQSARSKLDDFQRFIAENKDQIEALRILYSQPYRAGLRYRHVKELRDALQKPPISFHNPVKYLWQLYEMLEPDRITGTGGNALVDLVAIVKHAIKPEEALVPVTEQVEERFQIWLKQKVREGQKFTSEQMRWLRAIKDHIASSLTIEREDFKNVPFNQWGGLGRAFRVFDGDLDGVLAELNMRLAA